jgi:hypothetical protein
VRRVCLVAACWLAGSATLVARADVNVDQKPPTIEHRTFDPAHPPADMPPLKGVEAAVTESKFDCQVGMKYQVVGHKREADGCVTTLMVQSVQATLQLNVIIWLPVGATPKLTAHEEGHRRIAEQVYADAQRVARAIAASLDGKKVIGQGTDCSAADKNAIDSSSHRFCDEYLKQTSDVARRVGETYDDLTAHGTRAEPGEDEAIRQAFKHVAATDHPHS